MKEFHLKNQIQFLIRLFFFSYSNLGSLGKREGFLYLYIFANLQKYTYN